MVNEELLEKARHKFKTSNDDFPLVGYIYNLIIECYVRYEPSKRGNTLQKLMINYLNDYIGKAPSGWNKGDFFIKPRNIVNNHQLNKINDYLNSKELSKKLKNKKKIKKLREEFIKRIYDSISEFYEFKTSYLSSDGNYTIGNIRTYQNYDYLILLLVDCENSFNYRLLMIPKSELLGIKMSHMHGTKESNNDTKNPHLSFSITKGSDFERRLNKWCIYGGFEELKTFCKKNYYKSCHNVSTINKEQYEYIINDDIKMLLNEMGEYNLLNNKEFEVIPYIYKKFRKLKRNTFRRGESYWADENGVDYFYYQNRAFIVSDFVLTDISKKFNLTYGEVKRCLSTYFNKRYHSLKHFMVLEF
jgi:hypothetical protein